MIVKNLLELIGKTPMLEIQPGLMLKLERFNPGGSVKDRTALAMIEDAERKGVLVPGATIIEPTSGNTGVGLAWIGRLKGYQVILTMPETMSVERRNLLAAYGFIGGVGTGGTVSGVGRALKEKNMLVEIIAVEPASSPMLSEGKAGPHKIQGIGANFVPETYQAGYIDRVMTVTNEDAFAAARSLAKDHGLLVGISSGAAYSAALQLSQQPDYQGKNIVVLLPDTGERYLSVL